MAVLQRIFPKTLQEWAYNLSGFNQYGLFRDDLVYETEEVEEALRRLPAHIIDERNFRLIRAMQLDCQKRVLPKEQWTKLSEDVMYLQPYLKEVMKEKREREEWIASH